MASLSVSRCRSNRKRSENYQSDHRRPSSTKGAFGMGLLELDKKLGSHHHHNNRYIPVDGSIMPPENFDDNAEPPKNEEEIDFTLTEPFLKLNVGGYSFRIRANTVYRRLRGSRLAQFLLLDHEQRKSQCDGYLPDTEEYYFERAADLFELIIKFYLTGSLHRPQYVCLFEFLTELDYWQIPHVKLAPCCQHQPGYRTHSPRKTKEEKSVKEKPNPFKTVRHGDIRRKIWDFCEGSGTFWSNVFSSVSISFVLLSVSSLILGSIPEFQVPIVKNITSAAGVQQKTLWEPHPIFSHVETICIMWFTFEYLLRFCVSPTKCKFVCGVMNLVDAIAILPFYLELTLTICGIDIENLSDIKGALLVVRVLRVMRVVRILKLGRYSSGMKTFALTLSSSAKQLAMMSMVWSTGIVFFSTLVYFIEKDEEGTPFQSIPAAFWWCIVTMTTVGYGDVVPATIPGKLIASGAILSGVLVLALPITIMVDNFMKVSKTSSGGFGVPPPEEKSDDEDTITLFSVHSNSI